ncbi:hypothetical protein GCM10009091_33870 [Pseudomonas brenneri]|nr:hypothetical protein GCM10009091_33870 [Pseudomonas brenneri]
MIRIDSIWLATEPMDMRVARVIAVFGAAKSPVLTLFAKYVSERI